MLRDLVFFLGFMLLQSHSELRRRKQTVWKMPRS